MHTASHSFLICNALLPVGVTGKMHVMPVPVVSLLTLLESYLLPHLRLTFQFYLALSRKKCPGSLEQQNCKHCAELKAEPMAFRLLVRCCRSPRYCGIFRLPLLIRLLSFAKYKKSCFLSVQTCEKLNDNLVNLRMLPVAK